MASASNAGVTFLEAVGQGAGLRCLMVRIVSSSSDYNTECPSTDQAQSIAVIYKDRRAIELPSVPL